MNKMVRKVIIAVLIVALIISNVFFIRKAQQSDYRIQIGIPVNAAGNELSGIDFTKAEPLKNPDEISAILFALMNTQDAEKSELTDEIPNAVIFVGKEKSNVAQMTVTVWMNESTLVLKIGDDVNSGYKEIGNESYSADFQRILQEHISGSGN